MRRPAVCLQLALGLLACAAAFGEPPAPRWKLERLRPEDGLASPAVYSLLQDRVGFVWIGTEGGLHRYDGHDFEVFRHDPGNAASPAADDISFMLEDSGGGIWLATWGGGLDLLDPVTGSFRHFRGTPRGAGPEGDPGGLQDDRVQHLWQDPGGDLWIGTYSGGLSRLDRERGLFETFRHDPADPTSLCHDRVWRIVPDPSGAMWIGTGKGLCLFDRAEGTFRRFRHDPADPASLSDDIVRTLLLDAGGDLWVGTAGGLDRFRRQTETFEHFGTAPDGTAPDGLGDDVVTALLADGGGTLWVGTRGGGLHAFDHATGRWRHLRHDPDDLAGLSDDDVRALLEDRSGVLWIATRRGGVNQLDLGQVDPSRRAGPLRQAPVVLTGFESLGEELDLGRAPWAVENVRLSHEESFLVFELALLDYADRGSHRYRYMLEGHDRDWIDAGRHRLATYARVAPGDYVFRAQGRNGDAAWSDRELAVRLTIAPPFWRTWWFRSLAALGLLTAGAATYRLRIRALIRREQGLARRMESSLADLRRSEERYRLLFERNLAGVVRAGARGKVLECNEAFARILGYDSPRRCEDEHLLDLDESPDGRPSLLARLRQDGAVAGHEAAVHTRDGAMVTLLWNANLVAGEDGEDAVVEGTVIDVSERLRIEEGLRRAQKLESLGVLAGGIAHDFNNLLMGILGNAELSRMDLDPGSKIYRRLEQIEAAAQRAAELSKQMLAYSGKGEFVVNHLDLSQAVADMAHLLAGAVSKKVRLVYELASDLPAIEADAGQIEQIVMSLVTNASEASSAGGGSIIVASGSRHFSPDDLAQTYLYDAVPAGTYVFLRVTDEGCGMDEELQRKIFDPFFTTKFTGRGLGLAAVLGIVRGHRGAIRIDSAPGNGSTFTVLFPAAVAAPATPESPAGDLEALAPADGVGTILVVDDDRSVRLVVQDMVAALGFEVLTAADGREGLEVFRRHHDAVTLVILDLSMPRMNGEEAFREIRAVSPGARVILASGYEESESTRLFAGQGLSGFIQKPYRFKVLRQRIYQALSAS